IRVLRRCTSSPKRSESAMYLITEEDVLAYIAGAVTHPGLRAAIEHARDTDPQVQYWFFQYDPGAADDLVFESDVVMPAPFHPGRGWIIHHQPIIWGLCGDSSGKEPPPLDCTPALSVPAVIDTARGTVTLTYPAETIPLGVARIVAMRTSLE